MSESIVTSGWYLRWANFSSNNPYFEYRGFTGFNIEGIWMMTWSVGWDSCTDDSFSRIYRKPLVNNHSDGSIVFTTKNSSQEVDLVGTTLNKNCSEDEGVTINITSTQNVPAGVDWSKGETCAVVASSTFLPDPCQIEIDSAAASSISSSMDARACSGLNSPPNCSSKDHSAAQQLTTGDVVLFAATLGALGYMLV